MGKAQLLFRNCTKLGMIYIEMLGVCQSCTIMTIMALSPRVRAQRPLVHKQHWLHQKMYFVWIETAIISLWWPGIYRFVTLLWGLWKLFYFQSSTTYAIKNTIFKAGHKYTTSYFCLTITMIWYNLIKCTYEISRQ